MTERIDEPALYLGWLFSAYGHVLLEGLARLWAVGTVPVERFVFHTPELDRIPGYVLGFLKRLGIEEEQILVPRKPTIFREIHVPDASVALKEHAFRDAMRKTYRAIAGSPGALRERPIYISRARLAWHRRLVVGEEILESILAARGFDIVHPETLPIDEQIALFRDGTRFVGTIGSAMHNIVFCARQPHAVYLSFGHPNDNFVLCDSLVDADALYVRCCDYGGLPNFGRQTPLRLDLSVALEALRQEGLIEAIDVSAQQAEVDARHRELWGEVRLQLGLMRNGTEEALADFYKYYPGEPTPQLSELLAKSREQSKA